MFKVGLTGGIGSGKTTVCNIFEHLGVPAYSADRRAIILISNDPVLKEDITREFGDEAYTPTGYNRPYMADLVFRDKALLEKLNRIVHPAVARDFELWTQEQKNAKYVVHEAAILAESGFYKKMDRTIVVNAPRELRIQRVVKRDKTSREVVLSRIENQWPADKIMSIADWIVENDDKNLILPQVVFIHNQIKNSISAYG